ncbi:MAG: DcaP family trimeric outer membrane transporter [Marinifilaceae bacterium]
MKKLTIILMMTLLASVFAESQLSAQKVKVTSVSAEQDHYNFYTMMKEAFPLAFSDPASPRFIFYNSQKNFIFGMGGYVQLQGVYDFNGCNINNNNGYNYFVTSQIPMQHFGKKQPSPSFNLNVNQSTLFFKLIANTDVGRLNAYINMQFVGPNQTPQLQQAFIQFKGFTFGQAWSTFGDIAAAPNTIDLQGPPSALLVKNPMIRYGYNFNKNLSAELAVEYVVPTYTENKTKQLNPKAPDIPLAVKYQFKDGSYLRAAGIMRFLNYKENTPHNQSEHTVVGWGAALSGNVKLCKMANFQFQGVYGNGIATYVQDVSGIDYDLIPRHTEGRLSSPTNWGAYGAFNLNWCKRVQSNLVYSYSRMQNMETLGGSAYKYTQYALANVIWQFSEYGQMGLEYIYGRKNEYDKNYGNASRANLMVRYNF